jgi:signal transduction histidine kinase
MKWSLERKWMAGGFALCFLLMGIVKLISYQNATRLIDSNIKIEQSEQVLNRLTDIFALIADEEAERLAYILLENESDFKHHQQTIRSLKQSLTELREQIAIQPNRQQPLVKLQSLIAQRIVLGSRAIELYQADKSAIADQGWLINRLHQNRSAVGDVLETIQTQEEQLLQTWIAQSSTHNNYHLVIEILGSLLIFILLVGFYILLDRQLIKRQNAETEQKKLERDKEMSELKLRFFSMVSHEFRTPLSIILGSAQLLAESSQQGSEEKKRKNLYRIQSSARSMNQLLSTLLTLTRAEAGKLEFNPELIDVEAFCLNLIEDIQLGNESPRNIKFINQGRCIHAKLDEKLLHSILSNLLSNALKYSPSGSPVSLELRSESEAIIFEVCDRGIGIPPDNLAELYEPFSRGQNVGKTVGAGLGLAVVKKCLDVHQGEISVDSEIGVGTTVTVRIPSADERK